MASIGIGIGIEDLILQVLVLVLVLNFGNCQVLVLVLVLTLGSSEVLVLVSKKWYCPCLLHTTLLYGCDVTRPGLGRSRVSAE